MGRVTYALALVVLAFACGSGDSQIGRGNEDEALAAHGQALTSAPFVTLPADGVLPSQAFGTLEASSEVTADGAFNYSIPLRVPDGRAGLAPSVGLHYSSRGGNGLLGVGWSLAATSRITRCGVTRAQALMPRGLDFNTDFRVALNRYCLDGTLLIPTEERTSSLVVFRTERDDFSRVVGVYRDTENTDFRGDPLYFILYAKDGRIHEYGSRSTENHSRAEAPRYVLEAEPLPQITAPITYAWYLARTSDRSGNTVSYRYTPLLGGDPGGGAAVAPPVERLLTHILYSQTIPSLAPNATRPLEARCGIVADDCEPGSGGTGNTGNRGNTGNTGNLPSGGRPGSGGRGGSGGAPMVDPPPPAPPPAAAGTARREVRFLYENRPDILSAFAGGFDLTIRQRIRRIEMHAPNPLETSLLWSYNLGYQRSPYTGRSQLTSVAWCDGKGVCLPATKFDWNTNNVTPGRPPYGDANDFVIKPAVPLGGRLTRDEGFTRLMLLDLDGDGDDDLLHTVTDARETRCDMICSSHHVDIRVRLGSPSGLGGQIKVPSPFAPRPDHEIGFFSPFMIQRSRSADFDADGKVELFAHGSHWSTSSPGTFYAGYRTYTWNGSSLVGVTYVTETGGVEGIDFPLPNKFNDANIADVDGDGVLDALTPVPDPDPNVFFKRWAIRRGQPNHLTFDPPVTTDLAPYGGYAGSVADTDGNGRQELVQGTYSVEMGDNGQTPASEDQYQCRRARCSIYGHQRRWPQGLAGSEG